MLPPWSIALELPSLLVSQHLNILKAAGILAVQRVGNQMHYSVCNPEARQNSIGIEIIFFI